jgi:hypothetical protein
MFWVIWNATGILTLSNHIQVLPAPVALRGPNLQGGAPTYKGGTNLQGGEAKISLEKNSEILCRYDQVFHPQNNLCKNYPQFGGKRPKQILPAMSWTPPKLKGVDRGGTAVKVLCYKSEGRLFDPS